MRTFRFGKFKFGKHKFGDVSQGIKIGIAVTLLIVAAIIIYFIFKGTPATTVKTPATTPTPTVATTPTVKTPLKSGTYTIQSLYNNNYINVNNGTLTTTPTLNGNFTQWTIKSIDAANNLYSICNVGLTTNGCLNLVGTNGVSLSNYVSTAEGGNGAQSWAVNKLEDGNYEIILSWGTYLNPPTGKGPYLNIITNPPAKGQDPSIDPYAKTALSLWTNGSDSHKWIIKQV